MCPFVCIFFWCFVLLVNVKATSKIAPDNIEAILSTQNSLPPGTTKSLHTTPSYDRTVSPSQNYFHTTPGTTKSLHTTPGNNGTVSSSQNYQQTTLDNTSTINDNMEYLQTIFNSFSNHSTEIFKTPPTTPVTHETVWQDVPINSLELQLTPIRDYILYMHKLIFIQILKFNLYCFTYFKKVLLIINVYYYYLYICVNILC